MTTVHITKSLLPAPPPSPLPCQGCRINQKLKNASLLWSQNNEEPFRSKNLLEYSFSAALILHERKNSAASKILGVNF